jgi:haloalkane dehalogenase
MVRGRAHSRERCRSIAGVSGGNAADPAPGVFRTPDECFENLPGFEFEPHYRTVAGLRLAHVDTGEGPPVVMLHGEPCWSYIWRKLIPPLLDAGYRCVVPDHAGFGRSDKPTDPGWHSLERHVELTGSLLEDLDLSDVTLVVHDWGGPIGLSVARDHPDRVARVVILDTVLDPREVWVTDAWLGIRDFIEATEDLPIGELARATCVRDPGDEVVAAYQAPYPTTESKVGMRGLFAAVPRMEDHDEVARVEAFIASLRRDPRPMLILWGEEDLFLTLSSGQRLASRIGRRIDHVISDAGHALQEDQGELVAELIVDWLRSGG